MSGEPDDLQVVRTERPVRRVALAHHQRLVVEVLAARLSAEPDLEVLPPLRDLDPDDAAAQRADVLVAGSRVLGADPATGGSGVPPVRHPPLVVLADPDSTTPLADLVRALHAGVRGWLTPECGPDALLEAVRAVVAGRIWLPVDVYPEVVERLLEGEHGDPRLDTLTTREREVLAHLVAGRSTLLMAELMYLSPNTVRSHRNRLLAKLGVHSALEAVALARSQGLLPPAADPAAAARLVHPRGPREPVRT